MGGTAFKRRVIHSVVVAIAGQNNIVPLIGRFKGEPRGAAPPQM